MSPFHPEAIAQARAHQRHRPGTCASDDRKAKPQPACDCRPDGVELAEVWAGRARMARARQAAGRIRTRGPRDRSGVATAAWSADVLDDIDREALIRPGVSLGELGGAA